MTDESDDSVDAIRQRMAELRSDLTTDVEEVSRGARAMTDPRYYVRRFPWVSAAVAAAVGYMLVPKKKKQAITPDAEMLAELLRKNQVHVDTSKAANASPSMMKSLLMMGLTWAAKEGTNYIAQQLMAAHANKSADNAERAEIEEPAPSPVEEPWKAKG